MGDKKGIKLRELLQKLSITYAMWGWLIYFTKEKMKSRMIN